MSSAPSNAGQRGTTSLEFALTGGVFLVIMFAILDVGRFLAVEQSLNTVVALTARAAMVGTVSAGGTCPGTGVTLPASITGSVPMLNTTNLCVAVTSTTTSGQTQTSVNAQYTFAFVLPAWNSLSSTISDSTSLTY